MGADAKIPNPSAPVDIIFICYNCSKPVYKLDPIRNHSHCLDADGNLRVNFENENLEEI